MRNVILQAEALRALQILDRNKVTVSWVSGKAEFRSSAAPPAHVIALLDSHEPAIVELIRPNGEGKSLLDLARERHQPLLEAVEARLDLARERHRSLLEAVEAQCPSDVFDTQWKDALGLSDAQWKGVLKGLEVFLFSGWGDEAERLGWSKDELYDIPPMWARVDLCGAALLISDHEVVGITPNEIRIKTASGSSLAFYRKPAVDYGLAYRTRIKALGDDGLKEEPRLRALEALVDLYRSHHPGVDVDAAKAAVLAAMKPGAAP